MATNKSEPIIEAKPATRNIAGPPVFYPPGQELFAKSEAQAAWRAGVRFNHSIQLNQRFVY